ncbi:uncharacterized protein LOC118404341 [Branchiostoma floridae]|uniref:2'-phosphotransferase n=1 Tax=Branchiostoma floridae TaxID=7739 RepID=A0A9J7KGR1_BRAFL|nr:uncharacterized protein LOC118404341 [Branchiostoma floridae]
MTESSMEEQVNSDDQSEVSTQTIPPIKDLRLGKRLAYLLRYGAEKEGLQVREGGFVDIDELMTVPLLRHHQKQEVLREVRESTSYRGHKRFEERPEKDRTLVRALYRRRFERNPYHDGTKVPRLLEVCMEFVCNNIKQFDLECFQDDFIVNCMLHKLRRRRQLTNAVLRSLLSRSLDSLDLHDMYFTNGTARILVQKCPELRKLSLRDAGYAVNDQVVTMLVKNLPNLISLNLSGCKQVTQRSLQVINKYIPLIQHLNLGMIPLTQESLVDFVEKSCELLHLDVSENGLLMEEGAKLLAAICLSRNITFVSHFKF